VDGDTTIFIYDIYGRLIAECDGLFPKVQYFYLGDYPVAQMRYSGGQYYYAYYRNDHLGTPVKMVNALNQSQVIWSAEYSPFGSIISETNEGWNNLRFSGQYHDQELDLTGNIGYIYYNWNRYYNTRTGRYITPDPIGQLGGINLYNYVGNNPINFVDFLGLVLWYADVESESIFKPHIKLIMKSQRGRQLLKQLHDDPTIYRIHIGEKDEAERRGNDVYLDPDFHPLMVACDKTRKDFWFVQPSTTRMLAHELGHLTGIRDTGPGRMDNVNLLENPIMYPIEGYYRAFYDVVPQQGIPVIRKR
jgi:RHS repeat-associated protein